VRITHFTIQSFRSIKAQWTNFLLLASS
jgi:hypothetical protein